MQTFEMRALKQLLLLASYFALQLNSASGRHSPRICSTVCSYQFKVKFARTMTYTDSAGIMFNVELNSDNELVTVENSFRTVAEYPTIGDVGVVSPSDVITLDGVPRNLVVINDQHPGPAIEVMEGAQVRISLLRA